MIEVVLQLLFTTKIAIKLKCRTSLRIIPYICFYKIIQAACLVAPYGYMITTVQILIYASIPYLTI